MTAFRISFLGNFPAAGALPLYASGASGAADAGAVHALSRAGFPGHPLTTCLWPRGPAWWTWPCPVALGLHGGPRVPGALQEQRQELAVNIACRFFIFLF